MSCPEGEVCPTGGSKSQKGGKMNSFFKIMLDAKKKKLPSFVYTDKEGKKTTYHGHEHERLGMVYKKSKSPLKDDGAGPKKSKKSRKSRKKARKSKRKGKSKRRTRKKKSRRRRRRKR